jgi:hypothetical protein
MGVVVAGGGEQGEAGAKYKELLKMDPVFKAYKAFWAEQAGEHPHAGEAVVQLITVGRMAPPLRPHSFNPRPYLCH